MQGAVGAAFLGLPLQAQVCMGPREQLCVNLTMLQVLFCTFTDSVFLPVVATWGQGLSWGVSHKSDSAYACVIGQLGLLSSGHSKSKLLLSQHPLRL